MNAENSVKFKSEHIKRKNEHEMNAVHRHAHGTCGCSHCSSHEEGDGGELFRILASALLLALSLVLEHFGFFAFLEKDIEFLQTRFLLKCAVCGLLNLAAYLLVGLPVLRGAAANIRRGEFFGEEFLMSVASVGAIFLGESSEAVAVVLLYSVGEFFQEHAVEKSRRAIEELLKIRPDSANVLRGGKIVEVASESVEIGEVIESRPGERVALDGKIVFGETFADTSALTGEGVPKRLCEGDKILAGFINKSALVRIQVEKRAGESAADRILELTRKESEAKSSSEKFITRFSKVYTPIVCLAAILVALVPPLFWGDFPLWVHRALMFLVVSCPCALVISVPLAFFSGIGAASRNGILVKGSVFMERLSGIGTFVFDKTGTLTEGIFGVSGISPAEGFDGDGLLEIAALAESKSSHPIAKSVLRSFEEKFGRKIDESSVENVEEIAGMGVRCEIGGKEILVGSGKFLEENGIGFEKKFLENRGGSGVFVSVGGKFAGGILVSDKIKGNAGAVLAELKSLGIQKNVILSGDCGDSVSDVAEKVGADSFSHSLLPHEKLDLFEKIASEGRGSVAFAGDGINDAPVLARADVGVAMGAMGSDAAIEAADVVVMDDDLSRLCDSIRISRKTMRIVFENIAFSVAVKVAIMVLAAAGISNMWVAVFGDVGVCILAVLNSLRAFSWQKVSKISKISKISTRNEEFVI